MPQIARETVKERARRLREKGDAALRSQLDREIGMRRLVLAETAHTARTEQFLPVRLAAAAKSGSIFDIEIKGHNGRELLAA
jgi:threonylcarbamoyladenosine tRNA methylthiotransferase MtaB